MKPLLLLLLIAAGSLAQAQDKPLTEVEKTKERTYWRQHWSEKVKAEVVQTYGRVAMIRITNELPYNISKYRINLKWYNAKGQELPVPGYNNFEGHMKADTTNDVGIPLAPRAISLKVSVAYIELPKIGIKQDSH